VNNVGCHIIFSLDSVEGVNFAFDSDALTPAAENRLDDAIDMLQENPEIVVRIEGHTDSLGSEAYNMGLSERRAAAVVEYLVANGITRDRLTSVGMGENAPTADNNTEEGRARNRRVDFVIRNQ
jgi:OOP family OmpA-OmpF porin